MARQQVRSGDIENEGVRREDLNVSTPGQAVVRKLVQGSGVMLSANGADAGTGDVTISLPTDISVNKVSLNKIEVSSPTVAVATPMKENAQSMFFAEYGDKLRFKSPQLVEWRDNTLDWGAWMGALTWGAWPDITDGRPSTGVGIPNTFFANGGRVRFTYDIGEQWSDISQWRLCQEYHQRPYWITVEMSDDLSSWTTLISNRYCTDAMVQVHFHDDAYSNIWQRYVRITLQPDAGVTWYSNDWALNSIEAITFRPGAQGGVGFDKLLPFTWTPAKDLQLPAKLIVENDAELRRWMYIRDTVNGVSGISLYKADWSHAGYVSFTHLTNTLDIGVTSGTVRIGAGASIVEIQQHVSLAADKEIRFGGTPVLKTTGTGITMPGSTPAYKETEGGWGFETDQQLVDTMTMIENLRLAVADIADRLSNYHKLLDATNFI